MEGVTIEIAKEIFGHNFIGRDELNLISKVFSFDQEKLANSKLPEIDFSKDELRNCAETHFLILGFPFIENYRIISLNLLREIFGINPSISEPCFYYQDWYVKEKFALDQNLEFKWYLIRKAVHEENRGVLPIQFSNFHTALQIIYSFFIVNLVRGITLLQYDYVWTSDTDSNGDVIYVGKYNDPNGIAKNGFEIHRHLSLKMNYSTI